MGEEIAARADALARMEVLDTVAEVAITLGLAGFMFKAVKEPVGVAGAIIPWNFAMLMAA